LIEFLSANLFHALNTKNSKLLNHILDEDCLLINFDEHSLLGKFKVSEQLNHLTKDKQIHRISYVKDDPDTVLIAYQLMSEVTQFGSLIIRKNNNQKICFIKNILIQQ
jgi:hypothetical protein